MKSDKIIKVLEQNYNNEGILDYMHIKLLIKDRYKNDKKINYFLNFKNKNKLVVLIKN